MIETHLGPQRKCRLEEAVAGRSIDFQGGFIYTHGGPISDQLGLGLSHLCTQRANVGSVRLTVRLTFRLTVRLTVRFKSSMSMIGAGTNAVTTSG